MIQNFFISFFGKPEGIIISQLIISCQFTIYLSLIAFIGGGLIGVIITVLRIIPNKFLNSPSLLLSPFYARYINMRKFRAAARLRNEVITNGSSSNSPSRRFRSPLLRSVLLHNCRACAAN